jgi:hypothetical protein
MTDSNGTILTTLLEILHQVKNNGLLLHEIKGFVGFKEADDSATMKAVIPDSWVETEKEPLIPHNQLFKYNEYDVARLIASLRAGNSIESFSITVKIVDKDPKIHGFTYKTGHRKGEDGRVCNMIVEDGSGKIKVCGFDAQADLIYRQNIGEVVKLFAWKTEWDKSRTPVPQILLGKLSTIKTKQETLA